MIDYISTYAFTLRWMIEDWIFQPISKDFSGQDPSTRLPISPGDPTTLDATMQISIQTVLAAALLAPSVSCAPYSWSWSSWGQNAPAAASTPSATPSTSAPAATSTSSSSSSSSLSSDAQKALDAHNAARSDVGTAALVWDDTLASNAQEYGETLVSQYGSAGTLEHSQISDQGENLYWQGSSGDDIPMTNAANMWIGEKSEYNGETITESNYMNFGHYSKSPHGYLGTTQIRRISSLIICRETAQVVWKDTSKVGIAAVSDGAGGFYVVARYQEPGNMIGEAAY